MRRRRAFTAVAAMTGMVLAGLAAMSGAATAATGPQTYYVSPAGSDTNSGTSPSTPWKTLTPVNNTMLHPGDQLLLLRGGTWSGRLNVLGSGTATAPISVGAYGTATGLPTITGGAGGDCVRLNGDYVNVDSLAATACGYAGFNVFGKYDQITNSQASNGKVGIKVGAGSAFGSYQRNTLTNNNVMTVLTQGTNCGTATARNCSDDSGASAFLINGNDNDFGFNTVTGSNAFSYDFGRVGYAFQIYNGNRNVIHDNTSVDNLVLSDVSYSSTGTANGNAFRSNTVTATCGANCTNARGITVRGTGSSTAAVPATIIDGNAITLAGTNSQAITCFAGCPASTVITNNTLSAARALWMDGSGWTVNNNTLQGPTWAQLGSQWIGVAAGTRTVR
jgi:hypothetical protein